MKKTKLFAVAALFFSLWMFVITTALALFLPQAQLVHSGFQTLHKELLVSTVDSSIEPAANTFSRQAALSEITALQPEGETFRQKFWLKNISSQSQPLPLSATFYAGNGDWGALRSVIDVRLRHVVSQQTTHWMTIAEWIQQPPVFPGPFLSPNQANAYELEFRMLENYPADPDGDGPLEEGSRIGPELMGKRTSNVMFVITEKIESEE